MRVAGNGIQSVTAEDRRRLLDGMAVVDVRLADDHGRRRLPGALGNCVFEVGFLERATAAIPEKSSPVCVYGWSDASHEARVAAEKLARDGYTRVHLLEGGIEGWIADGLPTEGEGGTPPAPAPPGGRVPVDTAESVIQWTGRNLLNHHWGTLSIDSGQLDFDGDGALAGLDLVVRLDSMRCGDLDGDPLHDVLIDHLLSDDFFDAENHPTLRFRLDAAEPLPPATPGSPNLRVSGQLEIRGRTAPVAVDAVTGLTPDGRPAAQAAFPLDRTAWGVIYGSGRFFHRLAGHLVNDHVEVVAKIVGARADKPAVTRTPA